jgi:glycosyltransferase involved in cell wall biosynthesis
MALRRLTMPMVTRVADAITTWGDELARTHPGTLSLGERHITVFPPVDSADFVGDPARRTDARRELGIPDEALAVGTVGNRNPTKGHEYLVRAAAIVRERHPEAVFRILVDDQEVLRFLDPGPRVRELLPGLDIFAMTSVPRSEGMPTAILEAMASGLPVVATDVGAIAELVEDGVTGIVIPPLDADAAGRALLRLVEDPDLRRAMGDEGRRRARERYGLDRLAELHARAYEIALAHRRARSA